MAMAGSHLPLDQRDLHDYAVDHRLLYWQPVHNGSGLIDVRHGLDEVSAL
jgi:hypothetical protein